MAKRKHVHETDQEQLEEAVLQRAIQISKGKRKRTRDILELLNNPQINRKKKDKPDIVVQTEEAIIGIEHFLVEQVSEKQGNKRSSIILEKKKYIEDIISNQTKDKTEQHLRKQVLETIFDLTANANTTGIPELQDDFNYVFDKHISKVQEYRDNLNDIADDKRIKLALLIEIHCNADDVFLNNGKTVERRHYSIYPVFSWMVEKLEEIDPALVDYVVLYWRNSINEDIDDVVAIDTKDIRASFRQQQITVYEYCDDPAKISFNKLDITDKGLEYTTEVKNQDTYPDDLMPILQKAYHFKSNSIPFVAPRAIQAMICANGKARFKTYDTKVIMISEYTQETVLKRFDEFVAKYPTEKNRKQYITRKKSKRD